MVESVSRLHRRHDRDQARPLPVTQQGHGLGVAPEMGNVEADPFEGGEKVPKSIVAAGVRIAGSLKSDNFLNNKTARFYKMTFSLAFSCYFFHTSTMLKICLRFSDIICKFISKKKLNVARGSLGMKN